MFRQVYFNHAYLLVLRIIGVNLTFNGVHSCPLSKVYQGVAVVIRPWIQRVRACVRGRDFDHRRRMGQRSDSSGKGRAGAKPPRLLDQVCTTLRGMHYSYRTEKTYRYWIRFFILWSGKLIPATWARRR
jgi:integrase-like protein